MSEKVGLEMKLYRNTGTFGVPVWSEVGCARAVSRNGAAAVADLSARKHGVFQVQRKAQVQLSWSVELLADEDDTEFAAWYAAYMGAGDQTFEVALMNGDIATSANKGIRCRVDITQFSQNEPLADGVIANAEIVAAPFATGEGPQLYTVP